MRPIEMLLLLADLLTFSILATPRLRAVRWTGYAALITLLIAVAHVLVEGPRVHADRAVYSGVAAVHHRTCGRPRRTETDQSAVVGLVIGQR